MLFVSQIGRVLYILAVKMSMFIYLEDVKRCENLFI